MGELIRRAVPESLPDVGVDRWLGAEGRALRSSLAEPAPNPDACKRTTNPHHSLLSRKIFGRLLVLLDNPDRVTYMDNLHKYDAVMDRHLRHPKLLTALSELLGTDIDAFQVRFPAPFAKCFAHRGYWLG